MIGTVFTIGAILAVIAIILGVVLIKTTSKAAYTGYIPGAAFGAIGLIFLLIATLAKVEFMGAGLGGWGIACLFAAAISFIITSTVDAFGQEA